MGLVACLDSFGEEKYSSLPGIQTQSLAFPGHSTVIIQPTLFGKDLAQPEIRIMTEICLQDECISVQGLEHGPDYRRSRNTFEDRFCFYSNTVFILRFLNKPLPSTSGS